MRFAPPCGPFAGAAALVCCFGAVVEAEGAEARFAAEGEEVEDVAVGILAMRADEAGILFVHTGETLGWCIGVG